MKLFLSIPIKSHTDKNGNLNHNYEQQIKTLIKKLRESNHKVFCVLERLGWKMNSNEAPEVQFGAGLEGLDASEKMIVLLDNPLSPGVQIELGYAYAKNKKLEIYQIGEPAWSNMAFGKLTKAKVYPVTNDNFVEKILENNP